MTDTDTDTPTDTPTDAPPPADDAAVRQPPLVRRRRGRLLAGVAMGIARHLHVDVTLVRIGFVVLAFTGGAGIIAYVAGWVLLPEEADDATAPPPRWEQRGASFWVGVVLLVIASVVLVEHTTPFGHGVGTPLVLIAVGVALWKVSQDRADRDRDGVPVSDTTAPAPPDGDAVAATAPIPAVAAPPSPAPPAPTWTPPPSRPRSVLGRLTVALALAAVGVGAALDQAGELSFTLADALTTALAVVGLGLVVGTWFGRARGLIAVGLLLLPVVVAAHVLEDADVPFRAGAGDRFHHVAAPGDLAPRYELGAGLLQLDLTMLDAPGDDLATDVRLGAGEVELLVREGTGVVVDADVGYGAMDLPEGEVFGPQLHDRVVLTAADGGPTVHFDVRVGVGALSVRVIPASEVSP